MSNNYEKIPNMGTSKEQKSEYTPQSSGQEEANYATIVEANEVDNTDISLVQTSFSNKDDSETYPHETKKKKRNRLSQKDLDEIASYAVKLLKAGYSLKATAKTLSVNEEKLLVILNKKGMLNELGQQPPKIYYNNELLNIFSKLGSLVEVTEEADGFIVTPYKNNKHEGERYE